MLVHDKEVVSALRLAVAQRVGQDRFDLWFSKTQFVIAAPVLRIHSPNQFVLDWIRSNFRKEIQDAARETLGTIPDFEFLVVPPKQTDEGPSAPRPNHQNLINENTIVTPKRRFASLKTFQTCQRNNVAYSAAQMIANQPGESSPLLLYGPTGVGKTHLLEGIWSAVRGGGVNRRCIYLTAEQFTSFFLEALHGSGLPSFRRRYRELDLLIIEDLHFFKGKNATLNELLYTIDTMLRDGKQLAFSSDRSPAELAQITGAELNTRICGGLVASMSAPETATRINIARQMASSRGLALPHNVLELLAIQLPNDLRQIQGAINKLLAVQKAVGGPITLPLAEQSLEEVFHCSRPKVQLRDIERAVCDTFGVESDKLKSSSKSRAVSHPRMLAMWLARKYTRAALSEIGEYFGNRSHSTVISAEKKVNTWCSDRSTVRISKNDYQVEEAIRQIESRLRVG